MFFTFFICKFSKSLQEKNYIKTFEFYNFSIITLLIFSLIFHQILTKNQNFIFFLVPLAAAMSQVDLKFYDSKKENL